MIPPISISPETVMIRVSRVTPFKNRAKEKCICVESEM